MIGFACSECSTAVRCADDQLATFSCPSCGETAAPRCGDCGKHFAPIADETLCDDFCAEDAERAAAKEAARESWEARGDYEREQQRDAR